MPKYKVFVKRRTTRIFEETAPVIVEADSPEAAEAIVDERLTQQEVQQTLIDARWIAQNQEADRKMIEADRTGDFQTALFVPNRRKYPVEIHTASTD